MTNKNDLKFFLDHVTARFQIGPQQGPIYKAGKKHKHFKISLGLDHPNPEVSSVIYELDPTYYDPIRETDDSQSGFKTDITSYGDYTVKVKALKGKDVIAHNFKLSDLLKKGHKDSLDDPTIKEALDYIKQH